MQTKDVSGNYISTEAIVELVHDYFKDEKLLLIFDNVSTETKNIIGQYISKSHCNLLTSQLQNWGYDIHKIEIDVFPITDGIQFLTNSLKDEVIYEQVKEKLLSALSHHPLALGHAIAYMKEKQITVEKYLDRFEKYKISLLSKEVTLSIGTASQSVLRCLEMSLKEVTKYPDAFKLMNIISFLDGKCIHRNLIQMIFADEFQFDEALGILKSYSIVKYETLSNVLGDDPIEIVTIHDLYQIAIRAKQKENRSVEDWLNETLDLFFIKYSHQQQLLPDHVDFGIEWYLHLLHILDQECFERQTLQNIAKQQDIVFSTLETKVPYLVLKGIWGKVTFSLTQTKEIELFYIARLYEGYMDFLDTGYDNEASTNLIFQIFHEIKEQVTDPVALSIIKDSNMYDHLRYLHTKVNSLLSEHKKTPIILGNAKDTENTETFEEDACGSIINLIKNNQYSSALHQLNSEYPRYLSKFGKGYQIQITSLLYGSCYAALHQNDKALHWYKEAASIRSYKIPFMVDAVEEYLSLLQQENPRECLSEIKKYQALLLTDGNTG